MFDDLKDTVETYLRLKEELYKVETFLKHSLNNKLKNAKTESVVDTIIDLVGKQKTDIMTKLSNKIVELDIDEQINGRL